MNTATGTTLLLIAVASLCLPLIARRIRIPSMVLEIAFGALLGNSALKASFGQDWFQFLGQIGFLLLMFLAGIEIDFERLKAGSGKQFLAQTGVAAATLGIACLVAVSMDQGLFFALVLSTTSMGVVLPSLKETGLLEAPLGQNILIAATIADFFTLFGLTGYILLSTRGIGIHLFQPLIIFLLLFAVLLLVKRWAWWHPSDAQKLLGAADPAELGVRAAMALLFVFVGISVLVDVEPILGAFMGGSIISAVFPKKSRLKEKLSGFSFGFFIPIFFMTVGSRFPIVSLLSAHMILYSTLLITAAYIVKIAASLFMRFLGFGARECLLTGIILSARLSLIVAVAEIGVRRGILDPAMEPSLILVAAVTSSLSPVLFQRLFTKKRQ